MSYLVDGIVSAQPGIGVIEKRLHPSGACQQRGADGNPAFLRSRFVAMLVIDFIPPVLPGFFGLQPDRGQIVIVYPVIIGISAAEITQLDLFKTDRVPFNTCNSKARCFKILLEFFCSSGILNCPRIWLNSIHRRQ